MGIRDKPIAPGSPWQNTFAERLIGSIRRDCVDHMVDRELDGKIARLRALQNPVHVRWNARERVQKACPIGDQTPGI